MKNGIYEEGSTDCSRVCWYVNNQLHREDGPAIEWSDGDKEWCLNGLRHREDGPAFEGKNGDKVWWINDELHREDGPACEWADGTKAWYLNGVEYTEKEFNQWLEKKKLNERLNQELKEKPVVRKMKI